jgi:hypothetical protein
MSDYTHAELTKLIGDKLPGGGVPAAWWISTDDEVIRLFDQWKKSDRAHRERVHELATELGCTEWMQSGRGGTVRGFIPPREMTLYSGHPECIPVPDHWRIDSKSGYLMPSRKTKADRESDANEKFAAIKRAPQLETPGMPADLWLPGMVYGVQIRRGDACVMAFCGGDPDRVESRNDFAVDEGLWTRLPLSAFHLMREAVAS